MRPFLAGTYSRPGVLDGIAPRCNILESFYYIKPWQIELLGSFKSFILDSGAFSAMQGNLSCEWDEYVKRYCDFINEYDIDLFFEMDIDSIVGYDKVLDFRKIIERETKKKPIPVWHKSRGWEEYRRMCAEYEYVAFGGLITDGIPKSKIEASLDTFIQVAHDNGSKIHGLGYTNLEGLTKHRFDSVDSTAWLYGNRGGFLYRFNGRTLDKIKTPTGKKLNSREAARWNFIEWVKFCEFCESAY